MMKTLKVTHATLKVPLEIYVPSLFGFYFSEANKHTLLFSTGQTVIPVLESPDAISLQIERMSIQSHKGGLLQQAQEGEAELPIQGYAPISGNQGGGS